jgi:4'-phosphopantetheinyl transferase
MAPVALDLPSEVGLQTELWCLELLRWPSNQELASVSVAEREKAARFVFERDQRRYMAAHVGLRQVLARYCHTRPENLNFDQGPFGKPALYPPRCCAFNLSHSEDIAVILIAPRGEIGVDVEMLRCMPDAMTLAQRNFSAVECRSLDATGTAQRDQAFLTGWTRKEACLKAIGSGLSIAPDTFTAGLHHDRCTTTIPTPEGPATVTVQSFCHEERCVIAWAKVEPASAD